MDLADVVHRPKVLSSSSIHPSWLLRTRSWTQKFFMKCFGKSFQKGVWGTFFPFRVDPFQKGGIIVLTELSPLKKKTKKKNSSPYVSTWTILYLDPDLQYKALSPMRH